MAKMAKKKTIIKKKHTTLWVIIAILVVAAVVAAFFLLRGKDEPTTPTGTPNETTTSGDVAASVNGEIITSADVEKMFAALPPMYQQFVTKDQVLEQIIDEKLLLLEAKANGIKLEAGEVDREINTLKETNQLTQEAFVAALAQQNLTEPEFRVLLEKRMIIQKIFNQTILKNVVVSESDAKAYYDENKDQFFQKEEVRASHILVNTSDEANQIIAQLKKGANFSALAKEFSIDPSAQYNGGDLDFFARGAMVAEFETAAFKLKVGEISEPVKTQFGYHVITVTAKKAEQQIPYDEAKEQIIQGIKDKQGQVLFATYLTQLKAKNNVLYFGEFKNTTTQNGNGGTLTQPETNTPDTTEPTPSEPVTTTPETTTTPPAPTEPTTPSTATTLAGCLKSKGFTLYGASWNKDSIDQLALFGTEKSDLSYVECSVENDYAAMNQKCTDAGISGFPTWKYGKTILVGKQTIAKLKEVSAC
jgi:parvulin-like peptidyl-prolyl isomerase